MPENDIKICDMSTPSLAYLGDCVLELLVRERLTLSGISSSKSLNKAALKFVSAPAHAKYRSYKHAEKRNGRRIPHRNGHGSPFRISSLGRKKGPRPRALFSCVSL